MIKLNSVESMKNCGKEMSICLGDDEGYGQILREDAMAGDIEIWALISPSGKK